ncbi:Focal adhesion kinase 1 [Folsomia candida]|uniref:Focal adhesion kinase 1 n=1 Tax=Folsomia candida TaxID=158441 RepID=A0A226DUW9_FOLCA|nr:Focal adhesion kinase 1 [Folsomia candida]
MENLFLDERHILGKGAFGIVYKGILTKPDGPTVVAIKTVVNTVDVSYFKVLLSELRVMTNLGVHPNIVNLVGAVTSNIENRKLWMVMEFCELGNVSSYVTFSNGDEKVTSVLYSDLLKWSIQTASGMEFLGEKRIIHGDLSARNLLLTGTKDIKVSDFGLSRQLVYNSSLYVKKSDGPIPWKWMAPEALSDMNFSTSSDVYAFGITLWELFSYGEIPFSEWNYGKEFLDRLKCGDLFPEEPTIGGKDVYQVMMQCWKLDRRLRLSFTELKSIFLKMYNDEIRI